MSVKERGPREQSLQNVNKQVSSFLRVFEILSVALFINTDTERNTAVTCLRTQEAQMLCANGWRPQGVIKTVLGDEHNSGSCQKAQDLLSVCASGIRRNGSW